MTNRRKFLLQGGALLALPGMAQASATERVVISVPGPGNLLFLPITLAGLLGMDKEVGIELDIRYVGGGPLAYRTMLERNSDFSAGGLAALALQKLSGAPVMCVAPLTRVPAYTLLVRSSLKGKVKQLSDLRGRVLGVKGFAPGGRSTSQLFSEYVLKNAGVALDSVNFVSIGQNYDNQHAALASGAVDAIMGDEPFATRMVKEKASFQLADYHDLATTRKQLGGLFLNGQIATRDDVLATKPQTVERVVKMMQGTLAWISRNTPQKMVEALQIADADERANFLDVLAQRKNIYIPDGRFSNEQVATVQRFLRATENTPAAHAFELQSIILKRFAGAAT